MLEYFKHNINVSSNSKIIKIEIKFGGDGYMMFFKTLEYMIHNDGYLQEDELEVAAAWSRTIDIDKYLKFIPYCLDIGLFHKNEYGIYAKRIVEQLEAAANYSAKQSRNGKKSAETRKLQAEEKRKAQQNFNGGSTVVKQNLNGGSTVVEQPFEPINKSKVNKSKVNKSKVNKEKEIYDFFVSSFSSFENLFEEYLNAISEKVNITDDYIDLQLTNLKRLHNDKYDILAAIKKSKTMGWKNIYQDESAKGINGVNPDADYQRRKEEFERTRLANLAEDRKIMEGAMHNGK
jgi:hypothetical protein